MAKGVYFIPDGPKNLASLFPGIVWENVTDYYLEVEDVSHNVVATTPIIQSCKCCDEQGIRLYFLNYLGGFDGINFDKPVKVHEYSGGEFKTAPGYPLKKTDASIERINVTANDTFEVRRKSTEEEMPWLQEAADSIKTFIDWDGIEGQNDDYIPVVVLNGKFEKMKREGDYAYEFILTFKLSNKFFIQRS